MVLGCQEVNLSLVSAAPVVWASSHLPPVSAEWLGWGRGQVPVWETCEESRLSAQNTMVLSSGVPSSPRSLWGPAPLQPPPVFGSCHDPLCPGSSCSVRGWTYGL